jgi:ATP-binding cassette subfamily F protein 3
MIRRVTDFEGNITIGHSVMPGVFEQDQEEKLDQNKTVFETINELAVGDVRKQVRGLLGSFLFSGEDIDKKVRVLSGGERGKLALCKLLLEPYNLLLLDEPTNHLDIRSKEILKKALMDYEGTVILVSHDRDFLDGLANKLYEFREGNVKEHLCGINEFMEKRKLERLMELKTNVAERTEEKVKKEKPVVDDSREKEMKSLRSSIQKAEKQIEELESKLKQMDEEMQKGNDASADVYEKYNQVKSSLDTCMKEWEENCSKLNQLEKNG